MYWFCFWRDVVCGDSARLCTLAAGSLQLSSAVRRIWAGILIPMNATRESQETDDTGQALGTSVVWNFLGSLVPLGVGIVAIPLLIESLGLERFGVLSIAWLVVGYFSLFDLGLGRALTQLVAEYRGLSRDKEIPALIWTSLLLMLLMGGVGCLLLLWLSAPLASLLNITPVHVDEAIGVFRCLALSIPLVIVTIGLRAILEAYHQFRVINQVKIPASVATFLLPVVVLVFDNNLVSVAVGIIFTRLVVAIAYWRALARAQPELRKVAFTDKQSIKRLFQFGGWMTVSNVVGPLMVYMDGFAIGAVLTVSEVPFFTVPYEVSSKLWIFPGAIVTALFPLMAQRLTGARGSAEAIFFSSMRTLFIFLFPAVLLLVCLSQIGLELWLGAEFSAKSTLVLQLLLAGVFINSLAMFPYALLQGAGYPRVTAVIHLIELPLYVPLLLFMLVQYGIEGAALAWFSRAFLDMALLIFWAGRYLDDFRDKLWRAFGLQLLALLTILCAIFIPQWEVRAALLAGISILLIIYVSLIFRRLCRDHQRLDWPVVRRVIFGE